MEKNQEIVYSCDAGSAMCQVHLMRQFQVLETVVGALLLNELENLHIPCFALTLPTSNQNPGSILRTLANLWFFKKSFHKAQYERINY